ncbi:MAG: arylsulfatase [Armatimonadota bacterium]|jgi:arylsulfatase A-like enzyme
MDRREFMKIAGTSAATMALPRRAFGADGDKPNIVFIMVDDMGYADLGCCGSKQIATPNIDRMAAEGTQFTDAYSGCAVCAPARSVLMTGYHMGHTSVRGNSGGIPLLDEDVTVAEVLSAAGYACGGFGKWGLGDVGTAGVAEKQGFDVFYGYYHQVHAHSYFPDYLWRNSEKVPLPGNADGKQEQYSHHLIFDETLKFIRENGAGPFFCYAPWTPPHGRYEIPEDEPAWQMYKDKGWPQNAKVAAAMDSMVDRHVGELLGLLKELNLDERTIVFFCSDNGAAQRFDGVLDSSGPLRGRKRDVYEGGLRVPMIARWPGRVPAGRVSDLPWYFADVMPTLTELAGLQAPKGIDGMSVVPELIGEALAGRRQEQHEYMYWEWGRGRGGAPRAIRMGNWKGVKPGPDQPLELYDLRKDIGERNDVAAQHPDVVAKIEGYLATCRTEPRPQGEPEMPEGKRYR